MTLDEFKSIDEEMMNSNLHQRKKIYESLLLDQRELCLDKALKTTGITNKAAKAIINATGENK